ncbi:MAG: hypothetical protein GXP31_10715 [Kiritimatiellaeota bacterium]|nr:hypothetical protein [Kiritimatiellota bacterium]
MPLRISIVIVLALVVLLVAGCVSDETTTSTTGAAPIVRLGFDGSLADAVSGRDSFLPRVAEFAPGRRGRALVAGRAPVRCPLPAGFDVERGTVDMWVRPDFDCRDNAYHILFDLPTGSKGRVYLIKSGKGGANGLFLCVVDERAVWLAANVFPGQGYEWKAGEWHRVGGSWDGARGLLVLAFDGEEVAVTRTAPWRLGGTARTFFLGGASGGGNLFRGRIDEFRLYREAAVQSVVAWARNTRDPKRTAWRVIDGDTDDLASWDGAGAPNWVEIDLPRPVRLAQVTVYPGALRYAAYPSTECSPRSYTVQGWVKGRWTPLAPPVSVPRYSGGSGVHRVTTDLRPTMLRRFRIYITDLYDGGCRVSSPNKAVVPPDERSVVIREIEWRTLEQVTAARRELVERRGNWGREIGAWRRRLEKDGRGVVSRALRYVYVGRLRTLEDELKRLSENDPEAPAAFGRRWEGVRAELAPWRECRVAPAETAVGPWPKGTVGRLELRVTPGETPHDFYPASMPLDLRVVEAALGHRVDPYRLRVVDLDAGGIETPSRFDRIAPARGALVWTMRDRSHTRFAVFFRPRSTQPPPAEATGTLGDCDRFYYDTVGRVGLPGNLWAATIVDWDGDGRRDIIAGRWTDYCHFWKNIGTRQDPAFSEREHWRVMDETDTPIVAKPRHPGLGFSIPMPVDFDGDGRLDLFMQTYYGEVPRFYRCLPDSNGVQEASRLPAGKRSRSRFPIVRSGVMPTGLEPGRVAFGDLDGDGRPDAVVVRRGAQSDRVQFQAGHGLSVEGRPVFGPAIPLDVEFVRNPAGSSRTVPALADIDADGDLDLFLCTPPRVLMFENTGVRRAWRFSRKPTIIQRNGKPFDTSEYYPWISWGDWDDDGDLDLVKCTGINVVLNQGDRRNCSLGKMIRPSSLQRRSIGRAGLRAPAVVDWDGDGRSDYITLGARGLDLRVSLRRGSFFKLPTSVAVDPNKLDWFGCPDPGEYYALYGNVKLVDWDADGDLDLFVTSEHSWRFGYIHVYENLGNGRFGPEIEWHPKPRHDYVAFVPGVHGQAALVTGEALVDFLSFRTSRHFDPNGGSIRFLFRPEWNRADKRVHTFFGTRQHPETAGVSALELKRFLTGAARHPPKKLPPPFALERTAEDRLRFRTWDTTLDTPPLGWGAGAWHEIEVRWGKAGRRILVDGKTLAADAAPVRPGKVGARFHIGSNPTFMVQRKREYPSRRAYHPTDFTQIVDGAIDDFEIRDTAGAALLTLAFDGNCDALQGAVGDRTTVGYRCTPGFADMNGDGRLDMIVMLNDGTRFNPGRLFLFANIGTKQNPTFDRGTPLELVGGIPFRCHVRTQVTPVDWDRDGRIDLILSTENCGQPINAAVDFFRNVGTRSRPVFDLRRPMNRLNAMLEAHHEVKLCAVDLTGNGVEDLVTSTDPGTRVIYRSFLEEAPVQVRIEAVVVRPGTSPLSSPSRSER